MHRVGDNLGKLLLVPIAYKAQVEIHYAVNTALVTFEDGGAIARILKGFVECICGFFARPDAEENARTEDRIDKARGIAREQPPIAAKSGVAIRVVAGGIDLRHSFRP